MSGKTSDCPSGQVRVDSLPFYRSSPTTAFSLARKDPGVVQENVKLVREGVVEGVSMVMQAKEFVNHVVDTGVAHSTAAHYQLLDEDNLPARVGLIAGTGLVGLLVGSLRGRMLKRIVYTMVGTGGGAAVCYPEYAREGGELVYQEGRKNVMVAYNFLAGVEGAPSLPSLSDISNMGTSTDMSLIASTMRRVLYLAASKMKDVYQLGQQKLAVLLEKNINNEKDGTIDEAATAFTVPEIRVATTNNNSK